MRQGRSISLTSSVSLKTDTVPCRLQTLDRIHAPAVIDVCFLLLISGHSFSVKSFGEEMSISSVIYRGYLGYRKASERYLW